MSSIIPEVEDGEAKLVKVSNEYSQGSDITKVSLVIEQIKSPTVQIRLFCAKKLSEVGKILGPSRIEEELIPFLTDLILNFEDNEEVFLEFSNQIADFLKILKDNGTVSVIGIRCLEILSGNDDETVRIASINHLADYTKTLDEYTIRNEIFPVMNRLMEGTDSKTKMSSFALFPVVYPKMEDANTKSDLLHVYDKISRDDSPSIRRASAENIATFCEIKDENVIKLLIKFYKSFLTDVSDIVRIATIKCTKKLISQLSSQEEIDDIIQKFTEAASADKSWRVKYSASECICDICNDFPESVCEQKFVPILMLYLKDVEPEVKCAVLSNISKFLPKISIQKFKDCFLGIFQDLSRDLNLHVREVYSSSLLKCIPYISANDKEMMITSIMPLLSRLLKDDVPEVQNAAIMDIGELIKISNENAELRTQCILPMITEGMKNTKWRFRNFIAENFLAVVDKIPKDILRSDYTPIITSFFTDNAKDIKETSWKILKVISEKVDKDFLADQMWSVQKDQFTSRNYIMRISTIKSIDYLKEIYDKNFLKNEVLKDIMDAVKKDKVPNVKFCAFKALESIALYLGDPSVKTSVVSFVKEILETPNEDTDVVFFGKETIKNLA